MTPGGAAAIRPSTRETGVVPPVDRGAVLGRNVVERRVPRQHELLAVLVGHGGGNLLKRLERRAQRAVGARLHDQGAGAGVPADAVGGAIDRRVVFVSAIALDGRNDADAAGAVVVDLSDGNLSHGFAAGP